MITLEMKEFADFDKEKVFRINITNDDLEELTNEDLQGYTHLTSLLLENNRNLKKIDLRGNTSLKYICLGTCDALTELNLDQTNIDNIDLYDLVGLESVELDDKQLLNLKALLSENITKQFLYIEDAILECFERRIAQAADGERQKKLTTAFESYLESEA